MLEGGEDRLRSPPRVRGTFGLREQVPVDPDGGRPDARAADVDADDVRYAFYSSSFLENAKAWMPS